MKKLFKPGARLLRIALVFAALVWLTDRGLSAYFDRPNLVLRNNSVSLAPLPYLLQDYHSFRGRRVVFLGSSVIAGNLYTSPEEAAPYLVERLLRKQYGLTDVRTFNFAVPGFTMGDIYLVLSALADDPPDLVVLALNVKFFCSYVVDASAIRHAALWGVGRPQDRRRVASQCRLTAWERGSSVLNQAIARRWALPRLLPLLGEIMTGRQNPLSQALAANIIEPINIKLVEPAAPPEFLRQAGRWQRLEPARVELLRTVYASIPAKQRNSNYYFYGQVLDQLQRERIKAVGYITPLNSAMNDRHHLLDPTAYAGFKREVRQMAAERDVPMLDLSDAIPEQWFGDLDHLLYPGHALLAQELAPAVAAGLAQ